MTKLYLMPSILETALYKKKPKVAYATLGSLLVLQTIYCRELIVNPYCEGKKFFVKRKFTNCIKHSVY